MNRKIIQKTSNAEFATKLQIFQSMYSRYKTVTSNLKIYSF